ncbi:putative GEM-like protein 8 isoform X2 [Cucurbita pepo subsp. pepo]|uniref:GEM-like protein 8 isoform X2 n=1 Tax=Cucurbita moschata TaxID=3662 RepID=A0A6J1FE51_CUCMO|nr:putative GEM-like protein 8 isoform X2 [Cucurbita moschata]XP_023551580.1 putative GEM-like protein 8 isoform X2 [Cucurbita pepo subsp. pepo]
MDALMTREVAGILVGSTAFQPVEKSLKRLLPAPIGSQSPDGEPRATKQCREDAVVSRGSKVGSFAHGVREHVRLGQKIRETVKGKLNLGAKILQVGGLRKVYKQLFSVREGEKLLKACQCHLSTTTGPLAGLLFISTHKLAFCSDKSLKLSSPTGELLRFHYKVVIPMGRIERVNQSKNVMKPSQKYLEIVTVDNFDFWFMGFQNFQKTFRFLQQAISHEWKTNC